MADLTTIHDPQFVHDPRRFPLCAPYTGGVGPSFTRVFMPAFMIAIGTKRDKFSNCKAHLSGTDPGGVRPSTAAQVRANPLHFSQPNPHNYGVREESAAAFENREAELFAYIRQHITNVGLLSDLDRLNTVYINKDYSQGCPVFPVPAPTPAVAGAPGAIPAGTPLYPADHPRAGTIVDQIDIAKYQAFGNSIARYAWGLVYAYGTKMLTPIYISRVPKLRLGYSEDG